MINKKPLINFIIWTFTLILIMIIGISNVFALTNNSNLRFYDNNGSSLTYVTTEYTANTGESTAIFTTTANSYGGAVMIQANTPLIQNHIYTIFLNVGAYNYGGQTQVSTKNCIGIGTTYNSAISNYVNCNITPKFTQSSGVTLDKERGLYFTFIANANATYILLPYTTANTCNNCMQYSFGYNIEDAGDSTNLSQSQVNNIINNQTTNINNSITQSQNAITNNSNVNRDTIINNQNSNKQAIIDNQNSNTQQQIESQKVCTNYNYNINNVSKENGYLSSNGSIVDGGTSFKHTNYIKLEKNQTYTLSTNFTNNNLHYCLYSSDKTLLSCQRYNSQSFTIILNDNGFIRYSTRETYQVNFTGKYCENGNQVISDSVNNLNDSITSDNVDDSDISNYFDDFNDFLDDNSTITQLITLPVTLYTAILNNLNGSCSPFNLGSLFGTDLILPCINISQYLGSSLWTMIDIIISGFAIYEIAKKFIKVFNNLSSLREGDVIDD